MSGRRFVFIAASLDGFIAGPDHDLSFLEPDSGEQLEDTFTPFFASVGALLMGRRTLDVVRGFDGEWPYGDTPVLVWTRRPLHSPMPTVRAVSGTIEEAVAEASARAGDRNIYLDGGALIRCALDAGLVDELIVTVVPRILGAGVPLFAGVTEARSLELCSSRPIGAGFVQLHYRVVPSHFLAP